MKSGAMAVLACSAALTLACGGSGENRDRLEQDTAVMDERAGEAAAEARTNLTGCLLAGGDAGSFVLQLPAAGDPAGASNASAAAPQGAPWTPGGTYAVVAASGQDLSPHLNKLVSIEGPFSSNTVGTAGMDAKDRTRDDRREAGRDAGDTNGLHVVRAERVTAVAEQCGPSGARSTTR